MNLTAIILGSDGAAVERTAASVRADSDTAWTVEVRAADDPAPWEGVETAGLMLLRAGDTIADGAGAAVTAALAEHAAVVGGHRLACAEDWGREVLPPVDPASLTADGLCTDCTLELSALAVRRDVLQHTGGPAPAQPGGDIALFCQLADAAVLVPVHHVLADVRCRRDHAAGTADVVARLAGVLASHVATDPHRARRIRRRLLATAYLDVADSSAPEATPGQIWPDVTADGDAAAVLVDVLWALRRARDEAQILRGGLDGIVADAPADTLVDPGWDASDLHASVAVVHASLAQRDAMSQWLHEEVAAREQLIGSMSANFEQLQQELARIDEVARSRHEAIVAQQDELVRQNEEVARLHQAVHDRALELERVGRALAEEAAGAAALAARVAELEAELALRPSARIAAELRKMRRITR